VEQMTVHIFDKKANKKMTYYGVKRIDVVDDIIWLDDEQFSTDDYDYVILIGGE
jgi:hypothetical protein